jgi:hypothetical protein
MFGGEEGDVPKAASELLAAVQAAADSARAADARPANLWPRPRFLQRAPRFLITPSVAGRGAQRAP